jgi:hydrogenase maturation protease
VLIAGVGNVFFGDDGFGVEVARRLARESWPSGVVVGEYGIRTVHLAYELLDHVDVFVAADAMPRGGAPGTLYLLEPDLDEASQATNADVHGMSLPAVFGIVRSMGGTMPRALIVGCEPEDLSERMGLGACVQNAVEPAMQMIREIVARELKGVPHEASKEVG